MNLIRRLVPCPSDLLILVLLYSIVQLQGADLANDPGLGWHLKTGEVIAQSGTIPRIDPFLFSASPRTWISDQWLSDLLMHGLLSYGSWPLLYAFFIGMFFLPFIVILRGRSIATTGKIFLSTISVFLCTKLASIHFIARPAVLSFIFFAIVYVIVHESASLLEEQKVDESGSFLRRRISLLAPLFVLWANVHPSFPLGLIILLVVLLAHGVTILFGERRSDFIRVQKWFGIVGVLILVCGCATLLNPYGYELHTSIYSLGKSEFFQRLNTEWRGPDFLSPEGELFLTVSLFIFGAHLLPYPKKHILTLFEVCMLLLFGVLSLRSIRFFPYFALVSIIPLTKSFVKIGDALWWKHHPVTTRFVMLFKGLNTFDTRSSRGYLAIGFALLMLCRGAIFEGKVPLIEGELGPSSKRYPYEAMEVLVSKSLTSSPLVVYASPDIGGFITWRGWPTVRAVLDDRNTLSGEGPYRDFLKEFRPYGAWHEVATAAGATHLLVKRETPMEQFLSHEKKLTEAFRGENDALFVLD